jgi:phosphohistidine phosphatase
MPSHVALLHDEAWRELKASDEEATPMILYLVQHGRASPKETDPERSLTEEGIAETEKVAVRAEKIGLHVSEIIHSGKKRARETAMILARHLTCGTAPSVSDDLDPDDDVTAIVASLGNKDSILLVGHLPFLERLVSSLVLGDPSIRLVRFTNSGIVCLETVEGRSGEKAWVVKWALTPEIA